MILDCPACGARYRLPDDAIPPEGKTVRCARCKHSWVELGQPLDEAAADKASPDQLASEGTIPSAAGPLSPLTPVIPLGTSPAESPRPASSQAAAADASPVVEWQPEPDQPRRRRRLWLLPLLLLVGLSLAAAAFITRIVEPPAFVSAYVTIPFVNRPSLTLPALDLTRIPYAGAWLDRRLNPPALPPVTLTLQANAEFHQLGNGSRMLALTGSVANPTGRQQAVPEIEALVLDDMRRPIYRWRIPAPLVALPSRSSATFDSSASGYPAEGVSVTLRFVREP